MGKHITVPVNLRNYIVVVAEPREIEECLEGVALLRSFPQGVADHPEEQKWPGFPA